MNGAFRYAPLGREGDFSGLSGLSASPTTHHNKNQNFPAFPPSEQERKKQTTVGKEKPPDYSNRQK